MECEDVEFIQVRQVSGIFPKEGEKFWVSPEVFTTATEVVATYFVDRAIHTWQKPGLFVVLCLDSLQSATSHGSFFVINEDYVKMFESNEGEDIIVGDYFIVSLNDQYVCRRNGPELIQVHWE